METRLFYLRVLLVAALLMLSFSVSLPSKAQVKPVSQKPSLSISPTQVFRDDFDGTSLDPDVWQIFTNSGTVSVDSGWVTLSRPDAGNAFPYVHTKYNLIPPNGNFAVRIGLQYLSVTVHGDGFSIDDRLPANGSPGSWAWQPTVYTLWQDSELGYVLFDYTGNTRYHTTAPNLNYHDVEFRWLDNTDEYYIDGQLANRVTRGSTVSRPVDLWFGNPVIPEGSARWTSFRIDYIEVDSLGAPASFLDLPVSYPGRGNPTREQFLSAWQRCTTSFFDHHFPGEKGTTGDGLLWLFTGDKLPGTNCTLYQNCYDGHEGYDFDDWACYGDAVYPVADGEIVASETGWKNDGYGNRVVIQHTGTGYKTLYGHLSSILVSSGSVSENTQIGVIGETGCPGCGTHLHLSVYYNDQLVDPSGWEPMPWYDDPYVANRGGPTSYRLWQYSPRRNTPVNDSVGATLVSPSGSSTISIPSNAYGDDYMIAITEIAPILLPSQLASANHAFTLQAQNFSGQGITNLNQDVTIEVHFESGDIEGIRANSLSLYTWNAELGKWLPLSTTISLPSTRSSLNPNIQNSSIASAVTRDIGYVALLGEPYLVYLPVVLR